MNRKATDWETITTACASGCPSTVSELAHTGTSLVLLQLLLPAHMRALQNPYPAQMTLCNSLALWIDPNTFAVAIGSDSLSVPFAPVSRVQPPRPHSICPRELAAHKLFPGTHSVCPLALLFGIFIREASRDPRSIVVWEGKGTSTVIGLRETEAHLRKQII